MSSETNMSFGNALRDFNGYNNSVHYFCMRPGAREGKCYICRRKIYGYNRSKGKLTELVNQNNVDREKEERRKNVVPIL